MTRTVISPEEGEVLRQLYAEYVAAVSQAGAVCIAKGMDSPEFQEADKAAGAIRRRIYEIRGDADQHWMA
ncbi:hypothetical protein H261_00600 [Paramagnetospirillum caucaseum]|uniref:Uncharacterized protein n=1 Tax=Paramagnetospirillum caucaseum TaxID=1244869 RepID=M3AGQ3_9PROT|nr:hypothetical protein [Paramagnetospirillum caucaseum]EME72033.1 hypothetical protein H261_00600 [Paramagnetospirillum caucaseum]